MSLVLYIIISQPQRKWLDMCRGAVAGSQQHPIANPAVLVAARWRPVLATERSVDAALTDAGHSLSGCEIPGWERLTGEWQ